jgi:hypothetical protein
MAALSAVAFLSPQASTLVVGASDKALLGFVGHC